MDALKSNWFVIVIAIVILAFVSYFIFDMNRYNVSGKKADGQELLASLSSKNISADEFYQNQAQFDSSLLYQMYKAAVIDESIEDSKDLKEQAKKLESTIESNFQSQYGDDYEFYLASQLSNYGYSSDDACYQFSLASVKEKEMNTKFIEDNFDTYKEAVQERNPRTVSIISFSVADADNLTEDEQKKKDNIDKEIKEESFASAATAFSEDTSTASNKGFYGYSDSTDVTSTSYSYYGTGLPNDVASAAQDLKKGDVSDWITVTTSSGSTMLYKVKVEETDLKALFESDNQDVKDAVINAFLSANSTLEMESIEYYASKLDIQFNDEETEQKIKAYISSYLDKEGSDSDE
ncbi:MAG: peptidylprolyl isomerase [Floccifex sp.]